MLHIGFLPTQCAKRDFGCSKLCFFALVMKNNVRDSIEK